MIPPGHRWGREGWSGKTEPGIMCDISFELHSRLGRVTIIAVLQLRSLGRLVGYFWLYWETQVKLTETIIYYFK